MKIGQFQVLRKSSNIDHLGKQHQSMFYSKERQKNIILTVEAPQVKIKEKFVQLAVICWNNSK